jgi:hypothetical protein
VNYSCPNPKCILVVNLGPTTNPIFEMDSILEHLKAEGLNVSISGGAIVLFRSQNGPRKDKSPHG